MRRHLSVCLAVVVLLGVKILWFDTALSGSREDASPATVDIRDVSAYDPPRPLAKGPEPFVPEKNTTELCHPHGFRKKSGLFCVVAGIEHSGTTMVSSLLMNAPDLYGAFELGFLLAPTPKQFAKASLVPPMLFEGLVEPTTNHWWGLSIDQRDKILRASCVAEQYHLLRKHSPIYEALDTSWLVDKTPAYYRNLHAIMQRTPGIPFVVTQKDDDSIRRSFAKRGESKKMIDTTLRTFHRQLELAQKHLPDRLFVMNYTAFTEKPNETMEEVFAFLGLLWDPAYLTNDEFNRKGKLIGRPASPGFNATRSDCKDCVTNPYGN